MSTRFQEIIKEEITAGFRNLNEISIPSRKRLRDAAGEEFDEALKMAVGKPEDSPEMKRLKIASRVILDRWETKDAGKKRG